VPLTVVVKIALAYVEGYEWLSRMLGPVVGVSGVGTPSVPPHVFTTLPPSVVASSASLSLSARPASATGMPPVVIPQSAPSPSISGLSVGPKPAFASAPQQDEPEPE